MASPPETPAARTPRAWPRIAQILHRGPRRRLETSAETSAFLSATPRISVLADCRAAEGIGALASVAAAYSGELELLVLDRDDASRPARERFLDDRPWLPSTLLHQTVDRSRGDSLNALAERARGEYVFVLSCKGGVYPSTFERLARALDADRRAVFSYPMVAALEGDRPVELLGSLPWEPRRLRRGSWIDEMALLRRKRLLELGGYCTDPRLAGWESYHLWCRCAEAGDHAAHVPQVLAWRQRSAAPGTPEMLALMRALFPRLLGEPDN